MAHESTPGTTPQDLASQVTDDDRSPEVKIRFKYDHNERSIYYALLEGLMCVIRDEMKNADKPLQIYFNSECDSAQTHFEFLNNNLLLGVKARSEVNARFLLIIQRVLVDDNISCLDFIYDNKYGNGDTRELHGLTVSKLTHSESIKDLKEMAKTLGVKIKGKTMKSALVDRLVREFYSQLALCTPPEELAPFERLTSLEDVKELVDLRHDEVDGPHDFDRLIISEFCDGQKVACSFSPNNPHIWGWEKIVELYHK